MKPIKTTKKICFVGDYGTGKSSIILRKNNNIFKENIEATIGACLNTIKYEINNYCIKLEIWDTAGSERYKSLVPLYYRCSDIIIVVYDVTCNDNIKSIKNWTTEIKNFINENTLIIIVGNKNDLLNNNNPKNYDEIINFCNSFKYQHFLISCKNNDNINTLFDFIVTTISDSLSSLPPLSSSSSLHSLSPSLILERYSYQPYSCGNC